MADSTLPLNAGTGGKTLDTESLTGAGAATVERQRLEVAGAALAEIARVINSAPAGTEYALVVRPIAPATQVVSQGTAANLNATVVGTVTANIGSAGTLALDATLTGGTAKMVNRGGAKGTTTAADITSNPVDANTQAMHVDGSKVTQPISATFAGAPNAVSQPALAVAMGGWDAVGATFRALAVKAGSAASSFSSDPAVTVDIRPGGVMQAATAMADAFANPTESRLASDNFLFNGTSWDRARGNWNTTTGDTGTKTVTFAGATQTNYRARGAIITIILGTVSGTTPTLAAQLQWSPDAGTTWLALGAALANLTTTSQTGAILAYPTNISTAGATPGALTVGSTMSLLLNVPLPRTWRLNYVIGGTTPSFAITSVQVNYIV